MSSYQEGIITIFICLTVFNFALVGTVIYFILRVRDMHRESQVERLKVQVLVDSMIEIFESKYKLYDEDETGGVSPGA